MSWLLKVVEGPAKGAEIALLADSHLRVGSSADCDIVIGDASLAPLAFELEVSEDAVMLISPDGTQTPMKPLEIRDFGTTAVAVGSGEEPWGELVRPAPVVEEPPAPDAAASEGAPKAESAATPDEKKKPCRRSPLVRIVETVVLVLLLLLLAALVWFLWLRTGEGGDVPAEPVRTVAPAVTLKDIAVQHGLSFGTEDGVPVLSGNLRRRTERLAIRALALAADSRCRFRLTDDETLLKASGELLFAYTDGALWASAASNGVVSIAGHAPDAAALKRALRALDADVKGVERVDATGVKVGGPTPVGRESAKLAFRSERIPEAKSAEPERKAPRRNYPIAGILTAPYPCVVMRDGHRVMEGALIGNALLLRIESDRLVLKDGGNEFEWKP